ncbi:MAG: HIT domain-containing protein [Candidatus Omnitrophica bacterium]|nr:HIT domain-containing protein [Candidatus Omnitrophota bacterium]
MSEDCLFCKIIDKEIPADIVYEDDQMIAFKDINPKSPVHLLFIPKKHIANLNDVSDEDASLIGRILVKIKDLAGESDVAEKGYRVVINCNQDAGQEVFHIHVHLLGGRKFEWPPG